jgi:hypothetical protein
MRAASLHDGRHAPAKRPGKPGPSHAVDRLRKKSARPLMGPDEALWMHNMMHLFILTLTLRPQTKAKQWLATFILVRNLAGDVGEEVFAEKLLQAYGLEGCPI